MLKGFALFIFENETAIRPKYVTLLDSKWFARTALLACK